MEQLIVIIRRFDSGETKKGISLRRCPLQNARYWFGARPQDKVPRENGRISFGTRYGVNPETNSERDGVFFKVSFLDFFLDFSRTIDPETTA